MSKQVLDDAKSAYAAWKDAPSGSYLEGVLADGIARDILPALISVAERRPQPIGLSDVNELATDTDFVIDDE